MEKKFGPSLLLLENSEAPDEQKATIASRNVQSLADVAPSPPQNNNTIKGPGKFLDVRRLILHNGRRKSRQEGEEGEEEQPL